MDNDLNKIEKNYKQTASEKSFSYKDEYWQDALLLLKKEERALFFKRFWFGISAMLLMLVGALFLINSFDSYIIDDHVSVQANSTLKNEETNKHLAQNSKYNSHFNNSVQHLNKSSIDTTVSSNNFDKNLIPKKGDNLLNTKSANTALPSKTPSDLAKKSNINSPKSRQGYNIPDKKYDNRIVANTTDEKKNNKVEPNTILLKKDITKRDTNFGTKKIVKTKTPLTLFEAKKLDSIGENDIIDPKIKPTKIPLISLEQNNKFSLVLNGGIKFNSGLYTNQIHTSFPYTGGEVYYQLSNKFNISLGAAWYVRSGIGYIKQDVVEVYGFGKTETTQINAFDKVYFAEIPLKISYQIKNNHLIGVGGAYSVALGGENRYWTNLADYGPNGLYTQENIEVKLKGSPAESYHNETSIFASYEYRYNRFGVEGRYYYGVSDFTNNEVFENDKNDKNSRFLITLKYLFIK